MLPFRRPPRWRSCVAAVLILLCTGCGGLGRPVGPKNASAFTFERVRAEALAGDPVKQNLLGYMHFTGQSAPHDWRRARVWFETAAGQGSVAAHYNLAIMRALGAGVRKDTAAAIVDFDAASEGALRSTTGRFDEPLFSDLGSLLKWACAPPRSAESEGAAIFGRFCSGCHGWRGISVLGSAPSFALGERMEKSDAELLRWITGGHGNMPAWDDKLPLHMRRSVLPYIRTLEDEHSRGVIHLTPPPPTEYFRFGPMNDMSPESRSRSDSLFIRVSEYPSNFCSGADRPAGG